MAKGRKHGGRPDRWKKNVKKVMKGQKRHLGEQHPVDDKYGEGKVQKRPRKEVISAKRLEHLQKVAQNHDSYSSDTEAGDADPYLELLGMLGIKAGSDINQWEKKWKEEEESEEDDRIDEEMEQNAENESEEEDKKTIKQVNGSKTQTGAEKLKNKGKSAIASNTEGDDVEVIDYWKESGEGKKSDDDDDEDDNDDDEDDNDDDEDDDDGDEDDNDGDDNNDDDDENDDDDDEDKGKHSTDAKDPFAIHFEQDMDESAEKHLSDLKSWHVKTTKISSFGSITEVIPSVKALPTVHTIIDKETTFIDLKLKARLLQGWEKTNKNSSSEGLFTPLQQDLFCHINSYQDVFYSNRTFQNGDEIRRLYCLHAVNHILKTCSRVTKNTEKIVQSWKDKKEIGELRDQGLTRPKVVILVPFRDAALKVVECLMEFVCPGDGGQVMNKKRFYEEFSDKDEPDSSKDNRPEDFKLMFAGNIDDCFRIGISVRKKAMTLYAKFYSSDIIVASPLGLRTIIGSEGEKSHEYDFLSSIEVVILDQTDVFLMQNWEHVQHIFEHLHLQPKDSHDVDFSRVRMWCLNGWSKYYRQSLIFSSFVSPEMNALFNRHCYNFAGKVQANLSDEPGFICQVVVQVPQAFHRFECSSFAEAADKRFSTFINKVLPEFKGSLMGHTAIFVPSYFDFVRLRNYFKREAIECAQISEYSQPKEIQRARTYFRLGKRPFLLFTERFFFFFRYRIRGIKNIIFYELPHYSSFYSDILNYMDTRQSRLDSQVNPVTCTVLYTKYNAMRLTGVVGTQRCDRMMSSDKQVHMFVTGDDEA